MFLMKLYIEVVLGQPLKTEKYQKRLKVTIPRSLILSPYVVSLVALFRLLPGSIAYFKLTNLAL